MRYRLKILSVLILMGNALNAQQLTQSFIFSTENVQTSRTGINQDQVTIVTENWKPGTYIAALFMDGKISESCKFSLIK